MTAGTEEALGWAGRTQRSFLAKAGPGISTIKSKFPFDALSFSFPIWVLPVRLPLGAFPGFLPQPVLTCLLAPCLPIDSAAQSWCPLTERLQGPQEAQPQSGEPVGL